MKKTLSIASACYELDYEIVLNSNYGKNYFVITSQILRIREC